MDSTQTPTVGQVLTEIDDGVAIVTLDNAGSRNALAWSMIVELAGVWDRCDADDGIEVVILTGAGGNFCAGGDLKTMAVQAFGDEGVPLPEMMRIGFRALMRDQRLRVPVIAAIEGFAVGGGLELVLGTDIRIAGEGAQLSLPEAKRGLYPGAAGSVRLSQQVPYPVAAQMLLTGDAIDAETALKLGLVGEVVPTGTALTRGRELADRIRANSPISVQALTLALHGMRQDAEASALERELAATHMVLAAGDAHIGLAAFAEKRTASYR